jgi:hypothetical protein
MTKEDEWNEARTAAAPHYMPEKDDPNPTGHQAQEEARVVRITEVEQERKKLEQERSLHTN